MRIIFLFTFLFNMQFSNICDNCSYEGFNGFVCYDAIGNKFTHCSIDLGSKPRRLSTITEKCCIKKGVLYLKGFTYINTPSADSYLTKIANSYVFLALERKNTELDILDTLAVTDKNGHYEFELEIKKNKKYRIVYYHEKWSGEVDYLHRFKKNN